MQSLFSDNKKLVRLVFVMAFAPLAFALTSQYGFGLKPCELCIAQRIPYAVIIFFTLLAIIKPNIKIFLIAIVIAVHAFLIDSGIAFYHIGVEKHWWVNSGCSSTLNYNSFDDLKKSLLASAAVHCDEVQFEFLGISMAGWNFAYALIAAIFTIYALVKYFKNKKLQALHAAK